MKHITTFLTTVLFAVSSVEAKPLKVFILAGQSNMEGPANVSTFDYIGKHFAEATLAMKKAP
jgi:alpha-galactosidase